MTLELFHFGPSPYSTRVRIALEEKGLAWKSRVVDLTLMEHLEPWYLRLNPEGLIPALADGDELVCDSLAILRHLEARYPERPLLAAGGDERDEAEAWIERAQAAPLEQLHVALASPLALRAEKRGLPRILARIEAHRAANPDLAEVYTAKLEAFRARTAPYESPMPRDAALARIDEELDALERALAGRAWLAGERYSLADVLWTVVFARLAMIGQGPRLLREARPNVKRYVTALRARPSHKSADVWERISVGRALPMAFRALFGRARKSADYG